MPPPRSTWPRPTLPDEADRRGFWQGEHGPPVHIAQYVDGAHERRRSRHTLEDEGIEESWSPTADAGIVLGKHLVGIELFRPRQCLGLLNAREEAVPGDYRGDRVKGVLLVVAGRDQSSADAGVKADLLVDGAAIGLEGAGIRSIFEYGAGCTSPSALSGPAPPLQCPTPGNRNKRANSCVRRSAASRSS